MLLPSILLAVCCLLACSGKKSQVAADSQVAAVVTLSLTTVPPGAAVLDQGRDRLGHTPLVLKRKPGERLDLQLIKKGYRTARREILIEDRRRQRLVVHLRPHAATLVINTGMVRGADVIIDGKRRGTSPLRVVLPLGRHVVEVRREGTQPYRKEVELKIAKSKTTLQVPLLKPDSKLLTMGFLSVFSDRPAVVTAGTVLFGTTPLKRQRVSPGDYVLRLEAVGSKEVRTTKVSVKPKKHVTAKVSFSSNKP